MRHCEVAAATLFNRRLCLTTLTLAENYAFLLHGFSCGNSADDAAGQVALQ
jgi:hypothetical protein